MGEFDWKEEYSVKVSLFDNQHKQLFRLIEGLHKAMQSGKGNDVMSKLLDEFEQHTAAHFEEEEKLLKQNNYPKYDLQVNEHLKFTNELIRFQRVMGQHNIELSIAAINFMKDWLTDHILNKDKEYAPYLTKSGITKTYKIR